LAGKTASSPATPTEAQQRLTAIARAKTLQSRFQWKNGAHQAIWLMDKAW
jgi:hypothetical protein